MKSQRTPATVTIAVALAVLVVLDSSSSHITRGRSLAAIC
jgi:hypothetical protein